jgi:hypothetical protein
MAEKKKLKSMMQERNEMLESSMDYGGTAKVGEKEYEKKKKKSAMSAFLGMALGKK